MVVNPALILVSALFFLALASAFYLIAWCVASAFMRAGRGRFSHAANKRVLVLSLALPPVLTMIPTFGGATLRHSHMTDLTEHHSPVCQQMFTHLFAAERLAGPAATASDIAGTLVNGVAWLLIGTGAFLLVRLVRATLSLESGLTPFLKSPSSRLSDALVRVGRRMPGLSPGRFFECALPATYSSVLGLRRVRCVLSREFVAAASEEELDAVIAHEANHLRAHDVPVTLVVGALNCLFFPLRPVRLLARRWREEAELACDDAAVAVTRQPLALAAAILRVVGAPVSSDRTGRSLPTIVMPFADEAACSANKRVERLIVQAQAAALPTSRESAGQVWAGWLMTLTLAGLGAVILLSPGMICYAHCTLEAVSRLLP